MKLRHLHIIAVLVVLYIPTCIMAALKVGDTFITNGIRYEVINLNPKEVQVGPWASGPAIDKTTTGDIEIPATVKDSEGNTYSVTSIGTSAFHNCSSITSVTIPNTIKIIEDSGFSGCSSMESIYIPNSVKTIGRWSFGDCSKLSTVIIGNSVETIEEYAFANCYRIKSLRLPRSLKTIGDNGLAQMGLESITIPKSVTTIGKYILFFNQSLNSIVVEEGNTFYDSRNNCNSIICKATNEIIQGCKNSIIPQGIVSIADRAFHYMPIEEISFPSSLENIGEYAFGVMGSGIGLKALVIPKSVKFIGKGAFDNQGHLTSIVVEEGSTSFDTRDDCNALIRKSDNEIIRACANSTIPKTVTSVGAGAFSSLGYYHDSSGFTSIIIPNSVTTIGEGAFRYCHQLSSVTLSNNLKKIEYEAFEDCGIKSITIPASTETIEAFAFDQCWKLSSIISLSESPVRIGYDKYAKTYHDVFMNYKTPTLFVPIGAKAKYASTSGWDNFQNIVEMVELNPIGGDTTVKTEDLGGKDLSGNVVDGIYYNVRNGSYDTTDKSVVINEPTNMAQIKNKIPGTEEVKENFNGMILKVAKGKGLIIVNVKTTGNAQLVVQVGNGTPMIASRTEKGDVEVSYDVEEDTYVYIYTILSSSAVRSTRAVSANEIRIYSITINPGAGSAIIEVQQQQTASGYYLLNGQKLQNTPTKKGIYIVDGKKRVVR